MIKFPLTISYLHNYIVLLSIVLSVKIGIETKLDLVVVSNRLITHKNVTEDNQTEKIRTWPGPLDPFTTGAKRKDWPQSSFPG